MTKRTRSHELEDLSIIQLSKIFTKIGWTVERLNKDYGEDLLVRIFEEGSTTPYSFFIQAKATDNINRYKLKNGDFLSFPIKTNHLLHWNDLWEPVILIIWDSKNGKIYWECSQTFAESKIGEDRLNKNCKNISMLIPTRNLLDEEGLLKLTTLVKDRFKRFEYEKNGVEALIELLKEEYGLEIDYLPNVGVIVLPPGKFVEKKGKFLNGILFGKAKSFIDQYTKVMNKSHSEIFNEIIEEYNRKHDYLVNPKILVGKGSIKENGE